jgi:hypothetical protein
VQAKRGCAFKCDYCVYPQLEGTRYRNRPVEAIVDEIEGVGPHAGVSGQFFFADSVFNTPRAHTVDLCHELIRRRLDVRWMAYTNSARFDAEVAEVMLRSGCLGIEFGLDAVTDKMLHNWRKPFRQKDVRRSLRPCRDAGLPAAVHLLFGGPARTVADVRESQTFLDDCAPVDAVFASLGVRIYEGAPIVTRPGPKASSTNGLTSSSRRGTCRRARPRADAHARRHRRAARSLDHGDRLDEHARARDPDDHEPLRRQPQWRNIREYGRRMRSHPPALSA